MVARTGDRPVRYTRATMTRRGSARPTLFTAATARERPPAPLAERMRPRDLDEVLGQEHVTGHGTALRRAIESGFLPSMILWGPPGSGKTTVARLLAHGTNAEFGQLSAVTAGVADLRRAAEEARERWALEKRRTVLFVDEIHRFNRAQQDVVLPFVEDGTLVFIGATTENPSFTVVGPLLSRTRIVVLKPLQPAHIERLARQALVDEQRGLGARSLELDPEALRLLVDASGGDARVALNALELAAAATEGSRIDAATVRAAFDRPIPQYDRAGEQHYNLVSAFIKSLRDSDPDAALYWMARMIEGGEDPLFIVRRMVILAAEDVGLADPRALLLATATEQAVRFVGLPEGYLPMSECAIYLALAPKSNSAIHSYAAALRDARATPAAPVPLHLRNAVTDLMRELGYGAGYQYAHVEAEHVALQTHRPEGTEQNRYYEPGELGEEPDLARGWRRRRERAHRTSETRGMEEPP